MDAVARRLGWYVGAGAGKAGRRPSPLRGRERKARGPLRAEDIHKFVEEAVGADLHAKRVLSLANGVTGVVHGAALTIHAIGQGLAAATGRNAKHGVKQVDRLLSNCGIDPAKLWNDWVPFVLGERKDVVVALDWTEFDRDDQSTLAAYVVTSHGRATPLVWRTVVKSTMKGKRNAYEDELLNDLAALLPAGVTVTIVADRGFGDSELYGVLEELGFKFIVRFRGDIWVTDSDGRRRKAQNWVGKNGRARRLKSPTVTGQQTAVGSVVCVHDRAMAEPWCLATNCDELSTRDIIRYYGRRFTIEETFRDQKDLRYGMGLKSTRIGKPERRDRLFFLAAMAHALLTLLGAAAEDCGLDRMLKVNTVKKRTHSLYRQGTFWYSAIPNMPSPRLTMLMKAFQARLSQHAVFSGVFGIL
jgi:hypothetical protein